MTQTTDSAQNTSTTVEAEELTTVSKESDIKSTVQKESKVGYAVKNLNRLHYFSHLFGGMTSVVRSRFFSGRPRPFSLSHMVTNRCNSDCPYCFWKHHSDKEELSLAEIKRIYGEAKKEGFMTSILWGGEPLLRDDLPEICKASQDNGMYTKLATNGYFLQDRPDFAKHTDLIFVSIDDIGERHNQLRRTPDLYDKAYNGILYMKKHYPKMRIYICHCVSTESDGNIKKVADLARDAGVLLYFVINKSNQDFEEWQGKNELKQYEKTDEQLAEDFRYIKKLKAEGYPIRNSEYFMDYIIEKKNYYTCHWPKVTMVVYSDGKVLRCYDRKPIADLKTQSLGEVIRSSEYRYVAENSGNCKLACLGNYSLDSSGLWNFDYKAIKSIAEFAIT
ncbi:MAG: radical SAM protein [Vampirovibrionia bacterium]